MRIRESFRELMSTAQSTTDSYACPEYILCVLGMHRSGTSCLTGSLQEAGLDLGECHTWNPHNLKGNRENQAIVDLNDAVLADNGGAWDCPPEQVTWRSDRLDAARELMAGYAGSSHFGFKDPRTLLTLGGWQSLFPQMCFVGVFRHPADVAQSLHNRSGMPLDAGLSLWHEYNRRLLRQYRQGHFPLLCFDEEPAVFQDKLQQVLGDLGLDARAWRGEFYAQELKTARADAGSSLPWPVRRLYRKLLRLAE